MSYRRERRCEVKKTNAALFPSSAEREALDISMSATLLSMYLPGRKPFCSDAAHVGITASTHSFKHIANILLSVFDRLKGRVSWDAILTRLLYLLYLLEHFWDLYHMLVCTHTYAYLDLSGATWSYLAPSGATWSYLELPRAIWRFLELSGAIWSYLELSGASWS